MRPTRRDFLLGGVGAGATLPLLRSPLTLAAALPVENRVLVVLQLKGGNDWLNTVVPATHPVYQAARPQIRISAAQGLPCGSSASNGPLYFHPALAGIKRLWDAGKVALVHGVGYPNQSFSHFRSEDVWYTADPTATGVVDGWLGRYFRDVYQGGYSIPSLLAQSTGSPALAGYGTPSITNPTLFAFQTDPATSLIDGRLEQNLLLANTRALRPTAHPNLSYVANVIDAAVNNSTLLQTVGTGYTPRATYPAAATNSLVTPLQLIARYITGGSSTPGAGLDTRCYYLSTPTIGDLPTNFDTHSGQGGATGNQATLLDRVSGALEAFYNDLQQWGHSQRVVILVWTEFTRRVGQNGSMGTDHGDAGGVVLIGDGIVGGNYGAYPDLTPILPPYDQRNLAPTTDFRDVYATLLQKWWGANPQLVIPGWNPTLMGFLP